MGSYDGDLRAGRAKAQAKLLDADCGYGGERQRAESHRLAASLTMKRLSLSGSDCVFQRGAGGVLGGLISPVRVQGVVW